MKILFHSPHQEAAAWRDAIAHALPEAELRAWQPGDTAPADYALVWRAPRAFFTPRDGLRAIFNLGAGVDALLALEREQPGTLPRDVPLVRLEDSGMAQQMIEYVAHAVLRYLRRFDEYETLQRECRWQVLAPHPRAGFTVAVPPTRRSRPMIDSRTPSRSPGTSSSENPGPRSRTYTSTPVAVPSM